MATTNLSALAKVHGLLLLGATEKKVKKSKDSEFAQVSHTSSNLNWDILQKISVDYFKRFRSYWRFLFGQAYRLSSLCSKTRRPMRWRALGASALKFCMDPYWPKRQQISRGEPWHSTFLQIRTLYRTYYRWSSLKQSCNVFSCLRNDGTI